MKSVEYKIEGKYYSTLKTEAASFSLKHWYFITRLHCILFQRVTILIFTTARTSGKLHEKPQKFLEQQHMLMTPNFIINTTTAVITFGHF
jgi:hypothetical protein